MHYESWCSLSNAELGRRDIAEVNLAASQYLPMAEDVDFTPLLRQIDQASDLCQAAISRAWGRRTSREFSLLSDNQFRLLVMVTTLQRELGVRYNLPFSEGEYDATDSRNLFLHGILSGHGGTCVTMPVLYLAIGRRLGFPLKLVKAKEHFFCRWEGSDGEKFNIEATCRGFKSDPDERYMNWPRPISAIELERGWYLRSLSAREELSQFLAARGNCFFDNLLTRQAIEAYDYACKIDPDCPAHQNHLGWSIILHRAMTALREQAKLDPLSMELSMPPPRTEWEAAMYPVVLQHLQRILSNHKNRRAATARDAFFQMSVGATNTGEVSCTIPS
ncbi:MAG: transglutaminase family protein [Pirellulaceae bacterium]